MNGCHDMLWYVNHTLCAAVRLRCLALRKVLVSPLSVLLFFFIRFYIEQIWLCLFTLTPYILSCWYVLWKSRYPAVRVIFQAIQSNVYKPLWIIFTQMSRPLYLGPFCGAYHCWPTKTNLTVRSRENLRSITVYSCNNCSRNIGLYILNYVYKRQGLPQGI